MTGNESEADERAEIAESLRWCLARADQLGEAMAAIYIDHAINILETPAEDAN